MHSRVFWAVLAEDTKMEMATVQPTLREINPVTKPEISESEKHILQIEDSAEFSSIRKEELDSPLDAFVLHDLLTKQECEALVKNTEEIGQYSFWNAKSAKTDYRDVHTIGTYF